MEKQTHGVVKWWNIELKDKTPAWAAKRDLDPGRADYPCRPRHGQGRIFLCGLYGSGCGHEPRGTYASMAGLRIERSSRLN